ncbi:MAG: hypothetical protein A2015_01690 [Spirochaetes bacterium GWF1_31_7]|nr:MAG: hypothetical protein A2Y30_03055 [Spirochaetes bacterium GWE1_32_154]OHD48312.1 MAG: hypothetical protein A2Y29_05570 [Spirochaetes bacterium GWE2_31_10]OHD49300.1 MAG: hypothetical protein A2015_01690 [Spirochaetes bacterium GWF1_31_7]OHD81135.1 MAG: hypothetical protein A2355_16530 [Spirochaetes bacterium RIFOXYB1_FULL_32_8]HBD92960.1 hypothetical protein [Spirochaetia bacterium]
MEDFYFDFAPECLIIIDYDSKIYKSNKKAITFFGKIVDSGFQLSNLAFNNTVKENIFQTQYIHTYFEFGFENRELTYRSTEGYLFHFLLSSEKITIEEKNLLFLSFKNVTDFISYKNIFEELYNSLSTKTIELDTVLAEKEKTYKLLKMKDDEMLRQLNLAKEVQRGLFPELIRKYGSYSVATKIQPASTISGDMVVFNEKSNDILDIVIADVTGHGIPAALITMLLKMSLQVALTSFDDPIYILDQINKDMHTVLSNSAIFATILFARVTFSTGEIIVVNCGHPSPIIVRANGNVEVDEIGGMLLGVVENLDFNIYNMKLEKGDSFILITDGITEASNNQDVFFENKFLEILKNNVKSDPQILIDTVMKNIFLHTGKSELQDDISIVCLKKENV